MGLMTQNNDDFKNPLYLLMFPFSNWKYEKSTGELQVIGVVILMSQSRVFLTGSVCLGFLPWVNVCVGFRDVEHLVCLPRLHPVVAAVHSL